MGATQPCAEALRASFQSLFPAFLHDLIIADHVLAKMKTSSSLGLSGTIGLAPRCLPIMVIDGEIT
jgi:hypothetical protein